MMDRENHDRTEALRRACCSVLGVIPPDGEQIGPNAYRYNLRDFMAGGGGGEITGPIEGTNGGGHG